MSVTSRPGSRPGAVDHGSHLPFYAQVKEALIGRIERGDWRPGDQLPSEAELCNLFGVSRTVIRQALSELTYEGLTVTIRGKGTFIAKPKIMEGLVQRLTGFYQDMEASGNAPVSRILKQRLVPASAKVSRALRLEPGQNVIEIERLRFVRSEPIVLVTTFLPHDLCSHVLQADLTHQSLYLLIERQCGVMLARGYRILEAVPANQREAELLQVAIGAPLMLIDSVSYLEDGTPIEYFHALHRGDRSRFEAEVVRVSAAPDKDASEI